MMPYVAADDTPRPGSPEAGAAGCLCPVLDNAHGRGAWGTAGSGAQYWINDACPLHGRDSTPDEGER